MRILTRSYSHAISVSQGEHVRLSRFIIREDISVFICVHLRLIKTLCALRSRRQRAGIFDFVRGKSFSGLRFLPLGVRNCIVWQNNHTEQDSDQ